MTPEAVRAWTIIGVMAVVFVAWGLSLWNRLP